MEWKYGNITSGIIAAAMEVHRELGPGFPEYVYCRALEIEFLGRDINALPEYPMPVYYKRSTITTRRVDFLVEDIIPTEIKAITQLDDAHLAQAINYLEAWNREIGLLINFGSPSLQFKRLLNRRFKPDLSSHDA
jgi:GxxExxY protein